MKRILFFLLFNGFLYQNNIAQTPISGVINEYAWVTAIDVDCQSKLTVDNISGFEVGMKVILIQHKGAIINESNTSAFGTILDYGAAGFYEKNEIDSIGDDCIFLKYKFLHDYDVFWEVQLVSMPSYENAIVTNTLTAQPWTVVKGGVLAFSVENDLILNANIDVSGKGHKGGTSLSILPNNCTWLIQQSDFYYNLNNWRGAEKGAGIAEFLVSKEAGKGPQATGGGGGNDHNAGGGGGSNVSFGGRGGENNEPATFGCKGLHPGLGGKMIDYDSLRVFFGGGGGAGHGNNDVGTNGGNGGGIIIIEAGNIISNNFKIISNGETPPDGGGDGAGGGGAGGSLVLIIDSIADSLALELKGGNGGSVNNGGGQRCHGPGGGGGGGLLQYNFGTGPWSVINNGGSPGLSVNSGSCPDSSNGAQAGTSGFSQQLPGISQSTTENGILVVETQPQSQVSCEGDPVLFTLTTNGNPLNYQWQYDTGSGFQIVTDGAAFSGALTDSLTVLNPLFFMSGWIFRCVITNDCGELITDTALLEVLATPFVTISPSFPHVCEDSSAVLNVNVLGSNLSYQYQWQVDEGTGFYNLLDDAVYSNTNTADLGISMASVAMDGFLYRCVITHDCGVLTSSVVQLIVDTAPTAQFDYSANGSLVNFNNLSSFNSINYIWDFGDNSTSSEVDPTHEYAQNGIYTVQLIATNNCGADTIFQEIGISFLAAPSAAFSLDSGTGCAPLLVQFTDLSTGEIDTWQWTFPGGTPNGSADQNPQVIYSSPGLFDVTLEVTNASGSDVITYVDYIFVDLPIFAGFSYSVNENVVSFTNTTQNATTFEWNFGDNSPESTEENPVHIYASPGVYLVTLVASNPLCGSAVSLTVEVIFTGVENGDDNKGIEIFPNPVSNILSINFLQKSGIKTLKVFHSNGQLVHEMQNFEGDYLEIDFAQFPAGMYMLEILTDEWVVIENIVKY